MKTEEPRIEIRAKQPDQIKAVLDAWGKASDEFDIDLLDLNEAPAWAERAYAEVVKVVMPGKRLPTSGEWDLELIGELLGRLQAFTKLYGGEIPMGSEVQAEWDKLQARADALPKTAALAARKKALGVDLATKFAAVGESIPRMMEAALASSHEDALKFQKGLMRGMTLGPDDLATARTFQRHTRTFWVIAVMWRTFSKCQTVAEVHRILCMAVGEDTVGDLKTFENRVVKVIGMKLGESGRPRKRT